MVPAHAPLVARGAPARVCLPFHRSPGVTRTGRRSRKHPRSRVPSPKRHTRNSARPCPWPQEPQRPTLCTFLPTADRPAKESPFGNIPSSPLCACGGQRCLRYDHVFLHLCSTSTERERRVDARGPGTQASSPERCPVGSTCLFRTSTITQHIPSP